jgi:hypothetical protein
MAFTSFDGKGMFHGKPDGETTLGRAFHEET